MATNTIQQQRVMTGFTLALTGAILFSSKGVFIKLAYGNDLTTESVMLYRMLLSLPVFLYFAIKGIKRLNLSSTRLTRRDVALLLFCGFFGYYLATWLSFYSLHFISVQLERLVLFSYPALIVGITACIHRKIPNWQILLAVILTYLGIIAVFSQEFSAAITPTASAPTGSTALWGLSMIMLSALSYAAFVIVSKPLIDKMGSLAFAGISTTVSAIAIIIHVGLLIAFGSNLAPYIISENSAIYLVIIALVGTVLPVFMLSEAVSLIGPERMAICGTMGPVANSAIAAAVIGEIFTVYHFIALVFACVGVTLIAVKPLRN